METRHYDAIVIGGGASGMICALTAASLGVKTVILEVNSRCGKKLLASGNGRCNLSNSFRSSDDYNSDFPDYALGRWGSEATVRFFKSVGMVTRSEEGRIYPYSESASTVLNTLRARLRFSGVEIVTDCPIVRVEKSHGGFRCVSVSGESFYAGRVVLASGSGASFGRESYELYAPYGHRCSVKIAALAPLKCAQVRGVQGVRAKVWAAIAADGTVLLREKGELLFKDGALSGVLAFRLSSAYARAIRKNPRAAVTVTIDFVPEYSIEDLAEIILSTDDAIEPYRGILHKAIGTWVAGSCPQDRSLLMSRQKAFALARACKGLELHIDGASDLSAAQTVCGGLETKAFDPKTMQSLLQKGLYAIGEVLDVDGQCGGYNLQWAWSSGVCCARAIAEETGC